MGTHTAATAEWQVSLIL